MLMERRSTISSSDSAVEATFRTPYTSWKITIFCPDMAVDAKLDSHTLYNSSCVNSDIYVSSEDGIVQVASPRRASVDTKLHYLSWLPAPCLETHNELITPLTHISANESYMQDCSSRPWLDTVAEFRKEVTGALVSFCNATQYSVGIISADLVLCSILDETGTLINTALNLPCPWHASQKLFAFEGRSAMSPTDADERLDCCWDMIASLQKQAKELETVDSTVPEPLRSSVLAYVEAQLDVVGNLLSKWDSQVRCTVGDLATSDPPDFDEHHASSLRLSIKAHEKAAGPQAKKICNIWGDSSDDEPGIATPSSPSDDESLLPKQGAVDKGLMQACQNMGIEIPEYQATNYPFKSAQGDLTKSMPYPPPSKLKQDQEYYKSLLIWNKLKAKQQGMALEREKEELLRAQSVKRQQVPNFTARRTVQGVMLQDHQMQLLLEDRKRVRIRKDRELQEQAELSLAQTITSQGLENPQSGYYRQLAFLEEQNKQRLLAARQEQVPSSTMREGILNSDQSSQQVSWVWAGMPQKFTLREEQATKNLVSQPHQQQDAMACIGKDPGLPHQPNFTSVDFQKRLAEHVAIIHANKDQSSASSTNSQASTIDSDAQVSYQMPTLSERRSLPIRGIRGGYMSPHNSDSELPNSGNNEDDSDEDESSSEEEYDGDDLDAAGVTPQKPPTTAANNPLLTDEPLVFQQRSKYFQRHQEIREKEAQKSSSHVSELSEYTLPTIPTGGLFGGGALFESEKAATSTDSLGSTKRKRDDEASSHVDKGKQKEVEEEEALLHDDIDDYERELRELEERNRKRAMIAKSV